jgi:large subunit ribosomal protein L18
MASAAKYVVQYRRKRALKTDYRKRLNLLKSGLPRLVVRPSNKHVVVQLVEYEPDGDMVVVQAFSKELVKYGWIHSTSSIPAAYLTGMLLASKAKGKISGELILDDGMHVSKRCSRVYAAVKGVLDGGLKVRVGEGMLPDESRIRGEHISTHLKRSENITGDFDRIRDSILSSKGKAE